MALSKSSTDACRRPRQTLPHLGRQLLLHRLVPRQKGCPAVAAHLARFGSNWRPRPSSRLAHPAVIDSSHPDSRHLSPDMGDRFDFLVSELKKRGIYRRSQTSHVARAFQPGDGVKDTGHAASQRPSRYSIPASSNSRRNSPTPIHHRNPYTATNTATTRCRPGRTGEREILIEYWPAAVPGRLESRSPIHLE